jgi:hypothetical protein
MVSCSVSRARHHIGKDNLRTELIILDAAVTELRTCEGELQGEAFEYFDSEMDTICARSFAAPPSSTVNNDGWTVVHRTSS